MSLCCNKLVPNFPCPAVLFHAQQQISSYIESFGTYKCFNVYRYSLLKWQRKDYVCYRKLSHKVVFILPA